MDSLKRLCTLSTRLLLVVAATVLSAMMFLTMADVVLRYVFGNPLPGAYEVIQYMMAIVIPFGIVYCAHEKGHVSVEVLFALLPERVQSILECVNSAIVLILFLLISWQSVRFVGETYESGLTSGVLYIPAYPFVAAISLGFVALCLVLLADFLGFLLETVGK